MKKGIAASALLVSLLLLGCGKKTQNAELPKVTEHTESWAEPRIVIETENFTGQLEAPVALEENPDASGGKCIAIKGGSGKPGVAHPVTGVKYPDRYGAATYKFTVKNPGKYRFWGRKFWEDGCGNSFTLIMNGGTPVEFGGDGVYDHWDWRPATVLFDLTTGENTLEVLNREDGVKLDKLILTTDLDFIPQGKE